MVKKIFLLTAVLFFFLQMKVIAEIIPFNRAWSFLQKDMSAGEFPGLSGNDWRAVDLPHDWSIEGAYGQVENGTDWQSGFLPAGIGWYRKTFDYPAQWIGKKVRIQFDGIYMNSKVWVNGHLLGERPNGYIGFVYDLTPFLKMGQNEITVKVDHDKPLSGRWYTGSGIYRNVKLLVSAPTHIPYSGIWFRSRNVTSAKADYTVEVEIASEKTDAIQVIAFLTDEKGILVDKRIQDVKAGSDGTCRIEGSIDTPHLWSPANPAIYTFTCQLVREGEILDENKLLVGFRSLIFDAKSGFYLNGNSLEIKGVCDHHTAGAVGAAVPEDILYYRLKLLKEMGCNAIRTAHNPFSPEFYTICDTLGLLVLNEGLDGWNVPKAKDDYGNYFEEWWKTDMSAFIKRDRNHPSVFMWSIGNEVPKPDQEIQRQLVELFHSLDPDRPVTQGGTDPTRGMNVSYDKNFQYLDVIGFNGNGEEVGEFERFKEKFPERCAIATEVPHSYQTRGVYRTKTQWRRRDFPAPWEKKGSIRWDEFEKRIFPIPDLSEEECFPEESANVYYQSSYDNASVRISARHSWQRTCSFPWLMGEFRWGSFDYLGEAEWPQRCGNFGVIDIAAIPKDAYYLYQSLWANKPMVHILPHWTHPGKEGKKIPVVVYTNCDSVELCLNDRSLGVRSNESEQLIWHIPYAPGRMQAIGYKNGEVKALDVQQTAGTPSEIFCTYNKRTLKAGSGDVVRIEVDVVDELGILCPLASGLVTFKIEGPLKLLGVDNGDPIAHINYKKEFCNFFRGKCVLLVQATENSGTGRILIESENLKSKKLYLNILK